MTAIVHAKPGEYGQAVTIRHPSTPSQPETWRDAQRTAVFTPASPSPQVLNDIPVARWHDHPTTDEDWNECRLLKPDLTEPTPPTGCKLSSGVICLEPDGRLWLVSPTNQFGGYKTTFAKGKCDPGLSLQANAVKETWEESGLQVRILGWLGDFNRSTSIARLYLGERVGGDPSDMGWESQAVRLAPPSKWDELLRHPRDKGIIESLRIWLSARP